MAFPLEASGTTTWHISMLMTKGVYASVKARQDQPGWQYDGFHDEGKTVTGGEVAAVLRSPKDLAAIRFLNPRVYVPRGLQADVDWSSEGTWELRWKDGTADTLDLGSNASSKWADAAERLLAELRSSLAGR